jgi:hypothetical protein
MRRTETAQEDEQMASSKQVQTARMRPREPLNERRRHG